MKKIFNVNLGGYPFTIDEDAYYQLNKYIDTIRKHFSDSEGCEEIIDDIESRMAELFNEFLQSKSIVGMKELDAVIKVMGRPEDFGAESIDDEVPSGHAFEDWTPKHSKHKIKTGKRLYRDEEDKVIGGVCSGVAAYFGVEEPLWIRLLFVLFVFGGGVSVILYPILWAIIPAAKTAGDRLKMRGEPTTVSNIAKTIDEQIDVLSHKINELGKDLGSKKKDNTSSFSLVGGFSRLFSALGGLVWGVIHAFKFVFKPIFAFVFGVLLLSLAVSFIGWLVSYFLSFPFLTFFGPNSFLSYMGGFSIFLSVGMPLLALILMIMKYFTSYRLPIVWRNGMAISWLGALFISMMILLRTGSEFSSRTSLSSLESYFVQDDVINITASQLHESTPTSLIRLDNLYLSKDGLANKGIYFELGKSADDYLHVEEIVNASGSNEKEARSNGEKVKLTYKLEGNTLALPHEFYLQRGNKFRGQNVKYKISVPEGKKLSIDPQVARRVINSNFKSKPYTSEIDDYSWEMTAEGLVSKEWNDKYNAQKDLDLKIFDHFNIEGNMEVLIKYGAVEEAYLLGSKTAIDEIQYLSTEQSSIVISETGGYNVKLVITTPQLNNLILKDVDDFSIEGFKSDKMDINMIDVDNSRLLLDIQHLTLDIDGKGQHTIMGSGEDLHVISDEFPTINADKYLVESLVIEGDVHRASTFYAKNNISCSQFTIDIINVVGNPEVNIIGDAQE